MLELLAALFEWIGDAFDGADAAAEVGEVQEVAAASASAAAMPLGFDAPEAVSNEAFGGSWVTANDGGIAADRFDPAPVKGPYTP